MNTVQILAKYNAGIMISYIFFCKNKSEFLFNDVIYTVAEPMLSGH